jgi:hypothetical protein
MNEPQFVIQTKNWIFQKLLIASKSKSEEYKRPEFVSALFHVNGKFGKFLKYPNQYSVGQLAILIKRHQELLEAILPIPSNTNYEKSLAALTKLIQESEQIINHYHLTV